jgi:Ser/Thr protein kinase RdoA (MazF antagonist)
LLKAIIDVLADYGIDAVSVEPLGTGLINQTWLVQHEVGEYCVLQKLNWHIPAVVNEDMDVVTRHLQAKGLCTPVPIRTLSDALWTEHSGDTWRLMTYVPGVSRDALETSAQATESGRLLAGFHVAVGDLDIHLQNQRPPIHDIQRHLNALKDACEQHSAHPRATEVKDLAARIFQHSAELPSLPVLQNRLVHGDPKISNLLFAEADGSGLCMVDLDTIAHMPLPLELGDAFRSWCSSQSEDAPNPEFSLEYFGAALEGYAEGSRGFVRPEEWGCFIDATKTILVELSARFCADVLNENYFGWDADRFSSASEHNLVRANNQLVVYESLQRQVADAEVLLRKSFS